MWTPDFMWVISLQSIQYRLLCMYRHNTSKWQVKGGCWGDGHPVYWLVDQDTSGISSHLPTVSSQPQKTHISLSSRVLFFSLSTVCLRLLLVCCTLPGSQGQNSEAYAEKQKTEKASELMLFCWLIIHIMDHSSLPCRELYLCWTVTDNLGQSVSIWVKVPSLGFCLSRNKPT